ncbi:hypothetical protein K4L44_04525 [Halosquirtibacter laminarini]|uniref:Uncharacterized protein n=1 Tax=Halosquirtibacter laminarini TaxID=3374600 RepID=A0AC61NR80_9BACT|nr:hypothetical protein K4L44_04525 [Prolixibacteraceae bacterium]
MKTILFTLLIGLSYFTSMAQTTTFDCDRYKIEFPGKFKFDSRSKTHFFHYTEKAELGEMVTLNIDVEAFTRKGNKHQNILITHRTKDGLTSEKVDLLMKNAYKPLKFEEVLETKDYTLRGGIHGKVSKCKNTAYGQVSYNFQFRFKVKNGICNLKYDFNQDEKALLKFDYDNFFSHIKFTEK